MNRSRLLKGLIALVVVLFASLSTARAHQLWDEHQALSNFSSAQAAVHAALNQAARKGLTRSELAPYTAASSRLDALPMPSTSIFWGTRETFYRKQAAAYRGVSAQISARIARVTALTRVQAGRALAALERDALRVSSLDLDTNAAASALARSRHLLAVDSTPRQFRGLTADAATTQRQLDASAAQRTAFVSHLLASTGSSLSAIQQQGQAELTGAQQQLSLIDLLGSRGAALDSSLNRLGAALQSERDPFRAAVKAAEIHDQSLAVGALYTRVVPSKLIVVSTEAQWAHMYENGTEVYNTAVTTGGPELPTDHGVFHIYLKISPFVFHSPWPIGSPYYYPPTPVDFWMPFDGGEGLHDASWRSNFGPGSNLAPTDLGTGNYILGTHGCVNLPYDAAQFVWNWAPVGTTVVVT